MAKKNMDSDHLIEEFDEESGLEFEHSDELDFAADEELLIEDADEDEDIPPSVLYKGISRPKTDEDWRQLLLDASREGAPAYKLTDTYKEGALLVHPQFGLGVVSKVISARKIEVIFESSKKLMAMSVSSPQ